MVLATIPEWFGLEHANAEYIQASRVKETWTVREAGEVVGVTLVDRHFPHVAEIYVTVVEKALHGQGIGTAMLRAIEADARTRGADSTSQDIGVLPTLTSATRSLGGAVRGSASFPWRKPTCGVRTRCA